MKAKVVYVTPEGESLAKWAGQVCYRSHDRSTATLVGFLRGLIAKGHWSVLEHWRASLLVECTEHEMLGLLLRNGLLTVQLQQQHIDDPDCTWLLTGNARMFMDMVRRPKTHGMFFWQNDLETTIHAALEEVCPLFFTDSPIELEEKPIVPLSESEHVQLLSVYAPPPSEIGHVDAAHYAATFYIHGVSRALTHQLVRHRMASYSQAGQRFCAEDGFPYVTPPQIRACQDSSEELYCKTVGQIQTAYKSLTGSGIKKEDARMLLPNACHTELVMTATLPALQNYFDLRCDSHAQWEIRGVAEQMKALLEAHC